MEGFEGSLGLRAVPELVVSVGPEEFFSKWAEI